MITFYALFYTFYCSVTLTLTILQGQILVDTKNQVEENFVSFSPIQSTSCILFIVQES